YVKPHLYMVTEKGPAYCLDAATGQPIWQERLPGTYGASPVYAGGKLYFLNEAGGATGGEPGGEFGNGARRAPGGRCHAPTAWAGGCGGGRGGRGGGGGGEGGGGAGGPGGRSGGFSPFPRRRGAQRPPGPPRRGSPATIMIASR